MLTKSQSQLLELIKAGLWRKPLDLTLFDSGQVDWYEILSLCDQQTVTGLVTDALSTMPKELRPPKSIFFQFIKETSEIEKENRLLYDVIPNLICEFKKDGISPIVLKGQGVGLCYPNPYRRTSGDVDLLVGFRLEDYETAKRTIERLGGKIGEKTKDYRKHAEYTLRDVIVELHGDIQLTICKNFDNHFHEWMIKCLTKEENVRKKSVDSLYIEMPPYRFDAIFIFAHAMNHYLTSGLGLRQICDWMCYLSKNNDKIDLNQLKQDVEFLGLTKLWKYFASLAVDGLGMNKELIPMYDVKFSAHSDRLLHHIFSTGNFGYLQRKKQIYRGNILVKKTKTLYGQLFVYWDNLWLLPTETFYCFNHFIIKGFKDLYRRT